MAEISTSDLVNEWLRIDVNPRTRQEIIDLQAANDVKELELRLRERILFGTAGLRAKMEAGFSRMNDVTVLQASQGLASYVASQPVPSSSFEKKHSVVIGHDHRHNSNTFAQLAAAAFILKGIKVLYLGTDIVATPMVPFAVDHYKASCGIMITASHNPAADNGYKVYWSNGCQIIPPYDHEIQSAILQNLEPVKETYEISSNLDQQAAATLFEAKRDEIVELYLKAVETKLIKRKVSGLKAVYTPMHGVGFEFATKIAQALDLTIYIPEKQKLPDPDFKTVKFPNPEEKGAADLAIAYADELGIDLVLMNDPDADRFSAAIKTADRNWRQLTGNELGFLFAQFITETTTVHDKMAMLNSTVSSQMIRSVAAKLGFLYADTLTGFKWIGNKAIELEAKGYTVPFAYEEAIGFMFNVVHDKDGLSAMTIFAQMFQHWKEQGKTGIEKLAEGFEKFGYYKEFNGYYVVPDLLTTPNIFNTEIRGQTITSAEQYPKTIGNYKVIAYRDLTLGFDSSTPDNKPTLPTDPTSQMITVEMVPISDAKSELDLVRFTARGSGTEPKLKLYIEGKSDSEERAYELAKDVWFVLRDKWFKPEKYNLIEKY